MNGDQQYTEILAAINRLELSLTRTTQNYEDYKESRKDIPRDIQDLKEKTAKCNIECRHHTEKTEVYFKKVDFLMTWYGRASALIVAFQVLILILVAVGRYIDVEFVAQNIIR